MATTLGAGAPGTPPTALPGADLSTLARNWWALALRGALALVFGVLTFLNPGVTLAALVLLYGAYALIGGALYIVAALRRRSAGARWGALLLAGAAGIAVGALTLWFPGVTGLFLLYAIAAWALITGVLEIAAAVRLRQAIRGEWLLALSGVLSVLFGLLLVVAPGAGALALALWVGAYAVAAGVVLLALAFRLRGHARRHDGADAAGGALRPV